MSRWGGDGPRGSADDLAYGDIPQRWDRDRFDRFGTRGGPPPRQFEEDYRYVERDSPSRRDVQVVDRVETRGPRFGGFEERERVVERDRYITPVRPRRRTDKELFGDVDPRELAGLALTPYRRRSVTREEIDVERRSVVPPPPRPGQLIRRQSSLDTFDRRPIPRYEREEIRVPVYRPVEVKYEDVRYRDYEPEDYREVEIQRERSVRRRKPKSSVAKSVKSVKSSKTKSVTTKQSSSSSSSSETVEEEFSEEESVHETIHDGGRSVHESIHESIHGSIHESTQPLERRFKKGKTRMPKRLVRREAINDLGYPFDEEEDFFVLKIALEKEQIDEVIKISESYKNGEKKTVYKFEEKIDEAPIEPQGEREEVVRTEWINPPTVVGARSRRAASHVGSRSVHESVHEEASVHESRHGGGESFHESAHESLNVSGHGAPRAVSVARTARSGRSRRRSSPPREFFEERKTVIESRPPPPPSAPPAPTYYEERRPEGTTFEERKTIVEERSPSHIHSPSHGGTLVVQEREYRSDRDIQAEILRLETERRAIRLEREADERRDLAVRIREHRPVGEEELQLVEYRDRVVRPGREVLEVYDRDRIVERERSPPRNVIRVEKDRKGRMALVRSTH